MVTCIIILLLLLFQKAAHCARIWYQAVSKKKKYKTSSESIHRHHRCLSIPFFYFSLLRLAVFFLQNCSPSGTGKILKSPDPLGRPSIQFVQGIAPLSVYFDFFKSGKWLLFFSVVLFANKAFLFPLRRKAIKRERESYIQEPKELKTKINLPLLGSIVANQQPAEHDCLLFKKKNQPSNHQFLQRPHTGRIKKMVFYFCFRNLTCSSKFLHNEPLSKIIIII